MWLQHPLLSHHPPGQSCWNSCGRPEQRRRNWGRPSESLKKISISIMEGRWDTRLFKEWSPATSHMFNDFSFVFLNSAEIVYSLNQDNLYVGCIHLWRTPFSVFHAALFWSLTASLLSKNKYHTFWQASLCVRALSVWIDQRKTVSACVWQVIWPSCENESQAGCENHIARQKKFFYLHDMFEMSHPLTVGTVIHWLERAEVSPRSVFSQEKYPYWSSTCLAINTLHFLPKQISWSEGAAGSGSPCSAVT